MNELDKKTAPINKLIENLKIMRNDDTTESGISMTTSPCNDMKEKFDLIKTLKVT